MNKYPNIFLIFIGAIILAAGLAICSVVDWLVTNLAAIVAGIGGLLFFIIFIADTYSYIKDTKAIKMNYEEEKADALISSLRNKTLNSAVKILIFMAVYGTIWVIAIIGINKYFGI